MRHTERMGSALTTIGLPVALGIIMFGLGLSLTPRDFARVAKHPKAVIIALICQLLVLPALCFGLVLLFQLPPVLAVGMLLLAASPGGTTANLYSHLFRGDVALNISLTAINSVLAVFTLPLITNLAIAYFLPGDESLGLQPAKVVEVFAIVLGPVALGMLVRWWRSAFADRMDRPVRIASVVILVVVIAGAIVSNLELLLENAGRLAGVTVVFCVLSLTIGYLVPRMLRVDRRQSIASSFEIGIHNATLAIVIAQTVIGSVEMSLPAGVYGVLMFFVALAFGFLIRGRGRGGADEVPVPVGSERRPRATRVGDGCRGDGAARTMSRAAAGPTPAADRAGGPEAGDGHGARGPARTSPRRVAADRLRDAGGAGARGRGGARRAWRRSSRRVTAANSPRHPLVPATRAPIAVRPSSRPTNRTSSPSRRRRPSRRARASAEPLEPDRASRSSRRARRAGPTARRRPPAPGCWPPRSRCSCCSAPASPCSGPCGTRSRRRRDSACSSASRRRRSSIGPTRWRPARACRARTSRRSARSGGRSATTSGCSATTSACACSRDGSTSSDGWRRARRSRSSPRTASPAASRPTTSATAPVRGGSGRATWSW